MNSNTRLTNLYLCYVKELRAFLCKRVGCKVLATELTQEAFIRILRYPDSTSIQNARALLYRIAGNLAIDHYRVYAKRPLSVYIDDLAEHDQPIFDLADPARIVAARQILTRLCVVIDELPPQCHRAFVLHKFDGHTHAEIAAILGITRNAVEKLLVRALVKLRNVLD
jgi:RNA polymerase sigma factor (sigma-70 family)